MLLLLIQLNAALRFDTPRGMVFWDLYKKGIGDDRCTYGIPASHMISKEAFSDDSSLTHSVQEIIYEGIAWLGIVGYDPH